METLPLELRNYVDREGSELLNGYIRFLTPKDAVTVRDIVKASGLWHGYAPFAVTAFADVFAWDEKEQSIWLYKFADGVERFVPVSAKYFALTARRNREFQADLFDLALYEQAREKLGALSDKECYTFEPAPALGGSKTLASVGKGALLPYLSILCALS